LNQLWSYYYENALSNINSNKLDSGIRNLILSLYHSDKYITYNALGLCYYRKGLILESLNSFKRAIEIYNNKDSQKYISIIETNLDKIDNIWNKINNFSNDKNYKKAFELIIDKEFTYFLGNTEYYNLFTGLLQYKLKKINNARFYWKNAYRINNENICTLKYLCTTQGIKDTLMKHFKKDWSFI
jgi:tetratricopeptide (TPR) repeat protein